MTHAVRRFQPHTLRFRKTLQCFEAFSRDVNANLDADLSTLVQDAYDAHLTALDVEIDFPALAVPAWTAFRSRYVSDLTGTFVHVDDADEVARDAIALAEEIRALICSETGRFEHSDHSEYYAAPRLARAPV